MSANQQELKTAEAQIVCEIVNPSDEYTIAHKDELILAVACSLLGRGKYALEAKDGRRVCPMFLFGGSDEWFAAKGVPDLVAFLRVRGMEVADALESVLIGGYRDREELDEATAKMTPEEKEAFLFKRHDRHRTSMNNIGAAAKSLAKLVRNAAEKHAEKASK